MISANQCLFCMTVLLCSVLSVSGKDVNVLPLSQATIEGVQKFVRDEGIMTVTELAYRLPEIMRANYVLIENSRSRQHTESAEFPRMILYLPTGDFFIGISTDPKMPNSDDIEMLQFIEDEGWRMGAFTLGGDTVKQNKPPAIHLGSAQTGGSCAACHGSPPRPIWGAYPTWEGAFGEKLSEPQAEALAKVWSNPKHPNQRLRALIRITDNPQPGDFLALLGKKRGYANEALNQVIANRHSHHLWNKINKHPKNALLKMSLLASGRDIAPYLDKTVVKDLEQYLGTEWLRSSMSTEYPLAGDEDKPLLLAGLDPKRDLSIALTIPECNSPTASQNGFAYWNVATVSMGDVLAVRTLIELRDGPLPQLKEILGLPVYQQNYPTQTPPEKLSVSSFLTFWQQSIAERDPENISAFLRINYMPMLNLMREKVFEKNTVTAASEPMNMYIRKLLDEEALQRVQRVQHEYPLEKR